jgi:hypothetical protein
MKVMLAEARVTSLIYYCIPQSLALVGEGAFASGGQSKSRETRCAKIDADLEDINSELLQRWLTQSIKISSFIAVELSTYRVGTIPTAYLIPNWITDEDEHALLGVVSRCPTDKWVQLKTRRLQNHGGIVRPSMVSEHLPPWLQVYVHGLSTMGYYLQNSWAGHHGAQRRSFVSQLGCNFISGKWCGFRVPSSSRS